MPKTMVFEENILEYNITLRQETTPCGLPKSQTAWGRLKSYIKNIRRMKNDIKTREDR
jgi:hypothetical protein